MLPDSGRIQEEDAANANRHGYLEARAGAAALHRGRRVSRDLAAAAGRLRPADAGADGVEVEFINAGHLLGSAYARVRIGGKTILFGGDLGRFGRPVLPDPTMVAEADYLLVESTYGNRVHEQDDNGEQLGAGRSTTTAERGGKLIIPAFAIGRVEELLYWVKRLEEERRIPVLPVFVDSPMATEALAGTPSACTSSTPRCSRKNATTRRRSARRRTDARRRAPAARAPRTSALRVLHRALPHDRVAAGVARS